MRAQSTRDSTGTLVGIVGVRGVSIPLPYSVVSISSLGRERFSNDSGVFLLRDLPAGPLALRVRHVGYTPAELTVTIRPGAVDTVRIALTHIAVRLSAVQVRGYSECKTPGAPRAASDSAFALVFDQLRQNADQYRLLTQEYPFRFAAERTLSRGLVSGDLRIDGVDTVVIDSRDSWRYKPGAVVAQSRNSLPGVPSLVLNIPTLVNFADQTFLDNHCFMNGGLETLDGVDLLRVDFTAAAKIETPDVDGSMYLDPSTFQIRRSVVRLSRIPRSLPNLRETEATTWFSDALASISMISGISAVNRMKTERARPASVAAMYEEQRLIRVQFINAMPGAEVKRP